MKIHSHSGEILIVGANLESTLIYYSESDLTNSQHPVKKPRKKGGKFYDVNLTGLDAHYEPDNFEDEKEDALTRELKKKNMRPEPDGEFLPIRLGDDPAKVVMIGSDLSD